MTLLFFSSLNAQINFPEKNIEGKNGDEIRIPFVNFSQNSSVFLELTIENPTVIYPEFISGSDNNQTDYFFNEDYGNYTVRTDNNSDTLFINSTFLSGRDSITKIYVVSEANGVENYDTLVIKNNYSDLTGTYKRFLYIENIYPNPQVGGQDINITFYLDIESNPVFRLYSITGKLIYEERKFYNAGQSQFKIESPDIPIGVYYLNIESPLGNETKKVVIVR